MTWLFIQGAAVFVGYRPSGLAAFAIAVTVISLATAARATGFLSTMPGARIVRLDVASIELMKKSAEEGASEEDREEARLDLLRKVLAIPVVDCAADDMSVRRALDLLLTFEDRRAGADLQ